MKAMLAFVFLSVFASFGAYAYSRADVKTVREAVMRELSRSQSEIVGIKSSLGESCSELTSVRRRIEEAKTNVLTTAISKRTDKAVMDMADKVAMEIVYTSSRDVALDELINAALIFVDTPDGDPKEQKCKAAMRTILAKITRADSCRVKLWGVK